MTISTKTFTIADPRTFDGDPFEVADRAAAQAEALASLLATSIHDAWVMARNAEMERQIIAGNDPDAAAFETGPHGKSFAAAEADVAKLVNKLSVLRKAAAFNPKGPLGP